MSIGSLASRLMANLNLKGVHFFDTPCVGFREFKMQDKKHDSESVRSQGISSAASCHSECKLRLSKAFHVFAATLIESLRSTTRPAQRRACERKKSVMQDKNCE